MLTLVACLGPDSAHHGAAARVVMQGLVEAAVARDDYDSALIAIAVWLRYSAARHLTWNRNYNVKPREISAAQVQRLISVRKHAFESVKPHSNGAEDIHTSHMQVLD